MTAETRYRVEKEVMENYAKSLEMPRIEPGQFGSIVADYKKKVKAAKERKKGTPSSEDSGGDVAVVGERMAARDLFSEGSFDSQGAFIYDVRPQDCRHLAFGNCFIQSRTGGRAPGLG